MIPIHRNYAEMIKFSSKDDVGYKRILAEIQKFVKQATKTTTLPKSHPKVGKIRRQQDKVLNNTQKQ